MAKGTFGERLKREREMREVSVKEITTATRIGPRFLEALENEEWHKLPGGIFNRGFVRSVARYLGLDEEALLSEYDLAHGEQTIAAPQPYESKIPRPPVWIPVLGVVGALLFLAGIVAGGRYGWRRYAAYRAAKHSSSAADQIQKQKPEDSSARGQAAAGGDGQTATPLDLSVSTSAATHVRVLADGKVVLDAELPAGETRHFSASQQFEVTAADSSDVLLEMNGRAMPPVGPSGASGTIVLSQKDLRQASGGTAQP